MNFWKYIDKSDGNYLLAITFGIDLRFYDIHFKRGGEDESKEEKTKHLESWTIDNKFERRRDDVGRKLNELDLNLIGHFPISKKISIFEISSRW